MKKTTTLIISTSIFLTACSWNPFASAPDPTPTPQPTPGFTQEQIDQIKQELEQTTGVTLPTTPPTQAPQPTLPDGTTPPQPTIAAQMRQDTVLVDQTNSNATGFATSEFENNQFMINALADLPQLQANEFYQAWIIRGQQDSDNYSQMKVQRLSKSKGGYIVDYTSGQDLTDHTKLIITKETQDDDTIETTVLSGEFGS